MIRISHHEGHEVRKVFHHGDTEITEKGRLHYEGQQGQQVFAAETQGSERKICSNRIANGKDSQSGIRNPKYHFVYMFAAYTVACLAGVSPAAEISCLPA